MNLDLGNILGRAFDLAKRHGLPIAAILFLLGVASNLISSMFTPSGYWQAVLSGNMQLMENYNQSLFELGNIVSSLISFVLSIVVGVSIYASLLHIIRGTGNKYKINAYGLPFEVYVKYGIYQFVYYALTLVGFALCVIPGFFVLVRFAFGGIYLLDHPEASLAAAFEFSWKKTRGHYFSLLGIGIVAFIIALLGILLCCIGIYFTLVIFHAAFALTYLALVGEDPERNAGQPYGVEYY